MSSIVGEEGDMGFRKVLLLSGDAGKVEVTIELTIYEGYNPDAKELSDAMRTSCEETFHYGLSTPHRKTIINCLKSPAGQFVGELIAIFRPGSGSLEVKLTKGKFRLLNQAFIPAGADRTQDKAVSSGLTQGNF